ncbi:MAG TPA: glycosyltransferase family 4 protein [Mucilaginibacter sp.]|jgi:glycosyltransferase involved in cell wall biosynthesis
MAKKIVLYTLQSFSTTGGIQKMARTLSHSLYTLAQRNKWDFRVWSAYDSNNDLMKQYLPAENFKGFGVNRVSFVFNILYTLKKPDIVVISHINMSIVGLLIKLTNPKCKILLIAHGIEVWRPLNTIKKRFLKHCDKIICVSNFTKQQMINKHQALPSKCIVLNNAVDPFIKLPATFNKPNNLLKRYNLTGDNYVIFTLTRLASSEQYKGHDQVIKAIGRLKNQFPGIKYMLSGKYDDNEEARIQRLIDEHHVQEHVILTGFIEEKDLPDYFLLADLFVLPSKKEGFGIVFIEALLYGLPVICGNSDGSVDAICNGKLGKAIDPDDLNELEAAITERLKVPLTETKRKYLQEQCMLHFNENEYINKLEQLIVNE